MSARRRRRDDGRGLAGCGPRVWPAAQASRSCWWKKPTRFCGPARPATPARACSKPSLQPGADAVRFAAAGPMRVLAVSADGCHVAGRSRPRPWAWQEDVAPARHAAARCRLRELLLVVWHEFLERRRRADSGGARPAAGRVLEPQPESARRELVEIAGDILLVVSGDRGRRSRAGAHQASQGRSRGIRRRSADWLRADRRIRWPTCARVAAFACALRSPALTRPSNAVDSEVASQSHAGMAELADALG